MNTKSDTHLPAVHKARDPQAVKLMEIVNRELLSFIRNLPYNLSQIGLALETYESSGLEGKFEGLAALHPSSATALWIFWDFYKELDEKVLIKVSEAGAMIALSAKLLDHVIDGQAKHFSQALLLIQTFVQHSDHLLKSVIPNSSPFWEDFDRLVHAYHVGMTREIQLRSEPAHFNLEDHMRISSAKACPGLITLAALSELQGDRGILSRIEPSAFLLSPAVQLIDDLLDWEMDHADKHATFFLTQLLLRSDEDFSWTISENQLGEGLRKTWLDVDYWKLAIQWLEGAVCEVDGIECQDWLAFIDGYLKLAKDRLQATVANHLRDIMSSISA